MSDLKQTIASTRNGVCALMRIWKDPDQSGLQPNQIRWRHAIVGTAWCVVASRYLVTAFHTFNSGKPREPQDRFFIFAAPGNGPTAYHTPVVGFPLERSDVDMAVVEIAPPSGFPAHVPPIAVTFNRPDDGERVITYGFPAPQINKATLNAKGDWCGGNLLLKSNANEGIVSGQFEENSRITFELNVGWHHGESGGPIIRLDMCAAFSIMQRYRVIETPHGKVAGPHQGNSLAAIDKELKALGANIV
jgi:hypothetical protein